MRCKLRNLNLKKRLILFFMLNSIIPIIVIGIFTYRVCYEVILDLAHNSATETINMAYNDIESLFSDTFSLCTMFSNDINIQKYLREDFESILEQYSSDLEGSMELTSASNYRKDIFGIYVIGDNKGRYKSNAFSFKTGDLTQTNWYEQISYSDGPVWFAPREGGFVVKASSNDRFISLGIPCIDKSSGEKFGVVVADINENVVTNSIKQGLSEGVICIVDNKGEILSKTKDISNFELLPKVQSKLVNYINGNNPVEEKSFNITDEDYLIVCRKLHNTEWWLIGVLSKNQITEDNQRITEIVVIALIVVSIAVLISSTIISDSVSRPVKELSVLMEKVEQGDMEVRMLDPYQDEFGKLSKSFNNMLDEMQHLMDSVYQNQRKLRLTELKALQSQIQPHFLYNTLDSVTWLLRLNRIDEGLQMLSALSSFFRISLSKGQELITIKNEVAHISNYLIIEKMIHDKRFEYEIYCSSSIYHYKTLKLLLQPLVENAINHAIPRDEEKTFIEINVYEKDNDIILSVSNTGVQLGQEQINNMRLRISCKSSKYDVDFQQGYGLYNVNERIQLYWGKEYGIKVKSTEEKTEVFINIPKMKGDDYIV